MPHKTLIFIPTYNERDNVPRMCKEIHNLGLDADLLFVDDNSPDGTADILESLKPTFSRLIVRRRSGKLGIGSAHVEAIQWAYKQGYDLMVTMDGDFSHSPLDIPSMLLAAVESDIVVGSRWIHSNSLPGWNVYRKFMTSLGHLLTRFVLGIPQDASGAFRAYRLDRLARALFTHINSKGYSFFFESLFLIHQNGYTIAEVPIILPARTYGHSKMTFADVWNSGCYIFSLRLAYLFRRRKFLIR